jgi:hypothetical protein
MSDACPQGLAEHLANHNSPWSHEGHESSAGPPSDSSSDGVIDWERTSAAMGPGHDEQSPAVPDDFLNFSFKNLELLGERNREMAETLDGLRSEFGASDPYR